MQTGIISHDSHIQDIFLIITHYTIWRPWSVPVNVENTTTLGGIASDVYNSMKDPLNLNLNISLQEDFMFGALDANGKWTGMLGAMQRNESDISGPYFITAERATLVDFSVPLSFSQLAIMSGLVPANRDPLLIFRIFTVKVWLFVVITTYLAAGAAALINLTFPSTSRKSKSEVFIKYTWLFYGTLLGKDLGSENRWFLRHALAYASFRLLICIWLIGPAVVLMNTYQGAITSTFAADRLKPKIESMEELHQSKSVKPATYPNSFPSSCFERLKGTKLESLNARVRENFKVPSIGNYPEWLSDVENGRTAFVAELTTLKSIVGNRFKYTGRCGIYVTPVDFCTAYIAFAFRKNYKPKLQQEFNKRLLWFMEGRQYHRQMLSSLANYDTCTQVNAGTTKSLELTDLTGAFIVYSIGTGVSAFVFVIEKSVKWRKSSEK